MRADEVLISAASIWEAALKIGLGKLDANIGDLVRGIEASGFSKLPVSAQDASAAAGLPSIHADPFYLMTADPILARYSDVVQLLE